MSDQIPSLLAAPVVTPRGFHLSANGDDPYETFQAYEFAFEVEMAKRYFDHDRYADIYGFVGELFDALAVPPNNIPQIFREHPDYQVADLAAWYSAAALVCIEKSRAALRATITPTMQGGRHAALWMHTSANMSALSLTVISGVEDVFIRKINSIQGKKGAILRWDKPAKTLKARGVAIMARYQSDMTLRSFLEAAEVGSIDGLTIRKEDDEYRVEITEYPPMNPGFAAYSTLEAWWTAARSST